MVTQFLIEGKYFYQNPNIFYTNNFLYPLFVPIYYFFWHTLYFILLYFVDAFTHNPNIYFGVRA